MKDLSSIEPEELAAWLQEMFTGVITCRAKLLNADWLRQRAFFLNQGTFGNQEGMITWCWLAEHDCIKLISRFKRILNRNFRNASLLMSLILTRSFHLNMKENQHATKRSLLVEKQRDFSDHSQPGNSLSGDGWCWTKNRTSWPPNWKLKISSFCYESPYWYYRPGHLIGVKKTA